MKILISGGAGYIGSTICSALLDSGHIPVILDSLVTGRAEFTTGRVFYRGDIADSAVVDRIFAEHPDIEACVHCAALIVVPDSVQRPYEYYRENVGKSIEFFKLLAGHGLKKIVFSSSASLYDKVPGYMVTEASPLKPSSPYARTKFMMEMVLSDFCAAYGMKGIALRYFNPIGADPKMRSGIHIPRPSHIVGKLVDALNGDIPLFEITGVDWDTRDGTGVRDYVHVWDLALAHVAALGKFDALFPNEESYRVINLGTGNGVTVRELVTAFEKVVGKPVPKKDSPPRPGDVAGAYANADTAFRLLGWKASLPIEKGISDAIEWSRVRLAKLGY
jgi:UDP-glucose 4-epimerase